MRAPPRLQVESGKGVLEGAWTLASLAGTESDMADRLADGRSRVGTWDLLAVTHLDSAAATLIWRAWGDTWPAAVALSAAHRRIFERLAVIPTDTGGDKHLPGFVPLTLLGATLLRTGHELRLLVALFGQLLLDLGYVMRRPGEFPWREFSANVYKAGAQALPVSALVGFLIGVTLSYLSSLQLQSVGADLFIVNILGISIIRELGPVLVAVLVAGRSGSAMTAQIGVMRVTEEIDALSTMGVSRSLRVVLPKILGLTAAMPLLVLWTSAAALWGGMLAALLQLDLSLSYFIDGLPRAVPVENLFIGLGKGVAFGFVVALVACHYGLRVKPNTESLSANTTRAVVASITNVILLDAVFAILTRQIGVP